MSRLPSSQLKDQDGFARLANQLVPAIPAARHE